ncbi:MAG: toprim domain-containing protein, partial [Desulfosporosinus sp.]
ALTQYLKDFPQINEIALHLDNDTPGRLAAKTITTLLYPSHIIFNEPPKCGKDYNDYLKITLKIRQPQERE